MYPNIHLLNFKNAICDFIICLAHSKLSIVDKIIMDNISFQNSDYTHLPCHCL